MSRSNCPTFPSPDYRLKGFDRTWQYMHGERHEISYNALPPGRYTLEVRQIDALGDAKNEVLSYGVTILPPWYWSLWAKIVYLLVIAALLVWIMNFYIMRRRLHQERLAKKRIMRCSTCFMPKPTPPVCAVWSRCATTWST